MSVRWPLQAWRATRVVLHFCAGLATTMGVFPFVDMANRRKLTQRWSARLLHLLHIEHRVLGEHDATQGNLLVVANHVSWLDIFALNAHRPLRFVAKAELAGWPLAGRLARGAGTIFISRERRHDTRRVNRDAAHALASGDVVGVFPEGTTTDGSTLLRFHASLLQPIIESQGQVAAVAIVYRDTRGARSLATVYGDETLMTSFWRVCGEPALVVELTYTGALDARGVHRRELAGAAEAAIRTALGLSPDAMAPGTHADRRVEPQ